MRKRMDVGLRTWVLGATAMGLMSVPVAGQTKNVAVTNSKKPMAKSTTVKTIELPLLLAVPMASDPSTDTILPASQVEVAASDKSEVQKQLELLYEKDGREMPDLKLNLQPLNSTKTPSQVVPSTAPAATARPVQTTPATVQKPGQVSPGYTKYQPASRSQTTAAPGQINSQPPKNYAAALAAQKQVQSPAQPSSQPSAPPRQNRLTGFFKRFVPSSRKPSISTPPIPPDYVNSVPDVPSATSAPLAGVPAMLPVAKTPALPMTPTVQMTTKPVLSQVPLQTTPLPLIPQTPIVVGFNPNLSDLLQPSLDLPQLAQQPLPLSSNVELDSLPPLMTEPDSRALVANSNESKIAIPSKEMITDFPNPFPEVTENQADLKKRPQPDRHPLEAEESVQQNETLTTDNSESSVESSKSNEDPYAVRVKDFAEPMIDETVEESNLSVVPEQSKPGSFTSPNALEVPQTADASSAVDTIPPAPPMPEISGSALDVGALKPAAEAEDSYIEKMRRIRERFGMKGLKGFCPVTLRDERELLDAKPEFFFTHRSQKFHFASAEARNKFEADPSNYAPAAYGADVVALGRDKDVVEGTLDFAAWFKGRLYLFGTQANYDAFVKSPVTYASPAGIE